MKKLVGILSFFVGFGFVVCIILGICLPTANEISSANVGIYKFCRGLNYFFNYLPAILFTAFVIGFSIYFGRNSEGSTDRFSKTMFERLKKVLITSLVFVFLLTLGSEVFVPLLNRKMIAIENQPKLINDYIKVGKNFYDEGFYERAAKYANAALELEPNSKDATTLKDKSDEEINRRNVSRSRFSLLDDEIDDFFGDKNEKSPRTEENLSTVYENYKEAQNAYKNEEWFNAHYYAGIALNFATETNPNYQDIKRLQTQAWNKLNEYHNLKKSENQQAFDKKYDGYLALLEKNDLKAYYIFTELSQSSYELLHDPDVSFYLDIAKNRIQDKYFFIDETFELKSFENANDIYFSYKYGDGSQDIFYFKGMTSVKNTGNSMQYLRNLIVVSLDSKGNVFSTMKVPYAKVVPVDTTEISSSLKEQINIDDSVDFVPYVILNSISRDSPESKIKPIYTNADGSVSNSPGFMFFPFSYDDFTMIETSANYSEFISLGNLFKFIKKASLFGFSPKVYANLFLNRLYYPLWILIIFIFAAIFAWNTRIRTNEYFKMTWVLVFPFTAVLAFLFYKFSVWIFKMINYALVSSFGFLSSIGVAAIIFVVLLILSLISFAAQRTKV